jgi:SAM-dependent methyltransferase
MTDPSIPLFEGSVPEIYDTVLVPMIFTAYAADLVERLAATGASSVLEIAAGSGVVTRAMAAGLPEAVSIVATDLAPPMLARAQAVGTSRPVEWRQADVMALPFDDDTFDAVVCQFGIMFFPDRAAACAEVARVLRPGGTFLFSTWGPVADNEFADTVESSVAAMFPDNPSTFISDIPHGYHDESAIRGDLRSGGFPDSATVDRMDETSRATGADAVAIAFCHGSPLRQEIEARDPSALDRATAVAAAALTDRFGTGPIEGRISGYVITAPTAG